MKHRLLLPLMICVLALAGCYRQAEEEFQPVDSSAVEQVDTRIVAVTAIQLSEAEVVAPSGDTAADAGAATSQAVGFITPEPPPGQVVQLTTIATTSFVVIAATPGMEDVATRIFTLPTPTVTFEETLDPDDECVYSVLPGDNLFRLSIVFETTVEALLEDNQLDSDALRIDQLLLIPGCEPSAPEAPADGAALDDTEATAEAEAEVEATAEADTVIATDTSAGITLQLPEGRRIHVVSAGETWASIALRYELSVDEISAANQLASSDQLIVGLELVIPALARVVPIDDAPEVEPILETPEG